MRNRCPWGVYGNIRHGAQFSAPIVRHNRRENRDPFASQRWQQSSGQVRSRPDGEKDIMPFKVHVAVANLHPELGESGIDIEVRLDGARSNQVEAPEFSGIVDEQIRAGCKFPECLELRRFAVDQEAFAGAKTIFLNRCLPVFLLRASLARPFRRLEFRGAEVLRDPNLPAQLSKTDRPVHDRANIARSRMEPAGQDNAKNKSGCSVQTSPCYRNSRRRRENTEKSEIRARFLATSCRHSRSQGARAN